MTAGRRALIVVAVFVAVALGCLWGGAVTTASAQSIQVLSASPDNAEQGTLSLPVTIKGNGFKKGAKAKFYLPNTSDTGGITVSSTRFIDSTQLVATIDVAGTATAARFDIVVQNTDGRTGKGTELFKVTEKTDPCALPGPLPSFSAYISDEPGFPGYLDGTFGGGTGRVIGPRHMYVWGTRALAIDGLGRMVVVGSIEDACQSNATSAWAITRYLPDGSPDLTFGPDGRGAVTMAFSGGSAAYAVAIQPDGKLLVAGGSPASRKGNAAYRPTLARFNQDGSLDVGFGTGGVVRIPGTTWGVFKAVAIQPDLKIIAVGGSDPSALVVRLLPSGTLDASFANGGQFIDTGVPGGYGSATDVVFQAIGSDRRILVGGAVSDTWANRHHRFAIWRLTSSGVVDKSFNATGLVVTGFDSYADFLEGVAVDPIDNDIVAAGYRDLTGVGLCQPVLARYDEHGALDPSFGVQGKVFLSLQADAPAFALAVAIQPDGHVVTGGSESSVPALIAWRVDALGVPDPYFGVAGRVDHQIAGGESYVSGHAIALQQDGRFVAAGSLGIPGNPNLRYAFVARIWQ
jgi:uncharacterized delta-60 repeat protein